MKYGKIKHSCGRSGWCCSPSGPKLKLAWVRNDKGEVITIDIYNHILNIRRQIWEGLRNSFKVKTTIPGVRPWQSSPNLKKLQKDFYCIYLKTFLQCLSGRKKWSFWLLDQYWRMGLENARWGKDKITNET